MTAPDAAVIVAARRQLHAVAESFISGPQYRNHGTIKLAARPDGIASTASPVVWIRGVRLLWADGDAPLNGPVSALVQASGIDAGPPPSTVYQSGAPLGDDAVIDIDPEAARAVYRALYAGQVAVTLVMPQAEPVLWPEHFDVGAGVDEVNYGVSAGDDHHPLPYAYVGPWAKRDGAFWNAPFGALLPLDITDGMKSLTAVVADFFRLAHQHL